MIEHVKEQKENFWTSSFKKLLMSTEDDKKMRVINKILRKALGGLDSEKIQHNRCDSFPKEKFRRKTNARRSLIMKEQSTPKNPLLINNNEPQFNNRQKADADLSDAHIYETIKVSRPEMITKNNKNERNNLINSILTSTTHTNDELKNIPNRLPITVANKIALFEQLSRSSSRNTADQYCTIESLRDELNTFFSDDLGETPSPIPRFKGRSDVEKKFVVNCFESRRKRGGCEVIKQRMGSGDIVLIDDEDNEGADKVGYANVDVGGVEEEGDGKRTLDEGVGVVGKRPRRVTQHSVLEAMEEIELLNGMDLITELHRRATEMEKHQEQQLYSFAVTPNKSNEDKEPLYATPNKTLKKATQNTEDNNNNCNETFFKLKQEADIQCKIMKQAAKALEVYRGGSCRDFVDVRSEVEAEKILLTAGCKYELLLQEIRHVHYETPQKSTNVGSVIVRDLMFELDNKQQLKESQWFVCIVSDEENVICSKAVEVGPECDVLIFDEVFGFDGLDAGFKLKAEIFSFRQNQHQKRKHNKLNKRVNKLSRKLLYKDLQTYSLVESSIPDTSFVREGKIFLTVSELTSQTKEWKLELQPNSQLTGKCDLEANIINVEVDVDKMGFLTVGSENYFGINWNRRWCVLRGTVLNYWNYPNEDCNPPLGSIDLRNCKQEVTNAKRSFCPKPKTLLMEGAGGEVYFLNADSIGEMHEWRNKLNKAYLALKSWNMLRIQLGTNV